MCRTGSTMYGYFFQKFLCIEVELKYFYENSLYDLFLANSKAVFLFYNRSLQCRLTNSLKWILNSWTYVNVDACHGFYRMPRWNT